MGTLLTKAFVIVNEKLRQVRSARPRRYSVGNELGLNASLDQRSTRFRPSFRTRLQRRTRDGSNTSILPTTSLNLGEPESGGWTPPLRRASFRLPPFVNIASIVSIVLFVRNVRNVPNVLYLARLSGL